MCEREVHPPVFIEIERDNSDRGRKIFFFEVDRRKRCEFSFAWIEINGCAAGAAGNHEVDGAVVVEIGCHNSHAGAIKAQRRFCAHIRESAVAVVPPEHVVSLRVGRSRRRGLHGDIEIEIAVVVIIHEGEANAAWFAPDADLVRHISKFSSAFVVIQTNAIGKTDRQVSMAVIVEIARCASQTTASQFKSRFSAYVGEFSVAKIVKQAAGSFVRTADEKEIWPAVAVVVEETRAGARPDLLVFSLGALDDGRDGLRSKTDGNGRWRVLCRAARQLRERETPLISVSGAERGAQMLGSYFLKFGEMLPCSIRIAAALVSAGDTEFR